MPNSHLNICEPVRIATLRIVWVSESRCARATDYLIAVQVSESKCARATDYLIAVQVSESKCTRATDYLIAVQSSRSREHSVRIRNRCTQNLISQNYYIISPSGFLLSS
jgi:fructoselysine-6-P-deglycase FrlB-like protein